jgi:hypothetical protein
MKRKASSRRRLRRVIKERGVGFGIGLLFGASP